MALARFQSLFGKTKAAIIGMIHVKPLPGTPLSRYRMEELIRMVSQEAEIYRDTGVDGVLVENMYDLPYLQGSLLSPETVACMTRLCQEVRAIIPRQIPCGVQILAGGNQEAVAVSKACGLQFVRAECFIFSHVADEGLMNGCAGNLLRYRRSIGADDVLVFTDIKKKHSAHAITSDVSIAETAKAAEFFLSDGVIITGSSTGEEADPKELDDVVKSADLPVLIGSGVTKDNVHMYMNAHAFIIGSHFKQRGRWTENLDHGRIKTFTETVKTLRDN